MAAAGESAPALAVTGLSHRIGGREILAGIELAVPPGRFTVLLGQNGAGKTTLFSLVTRRWR
jgi:ABC-2 type transport system ATP-binding protein